MGFKSNDVVTMTFQELLDQRLLAIGDGYRAMNSELTGGGEIFLRAGHVSDTHIDFEGVERFAPELTDRLIPKMSKVGDTIVTTKGNSTGRTSFVTERMPRFVYSPHLCFWRSLNPDRIDNGFLRYWARGAEFHNQLSALKTATDMAPYLSLTDQRRLKISLPPIKEQRSISSILGALDNKIELNRRMNATLESLMKSIFKSWFVDFDPVKMKTKGGIDQSRPEIMNSSLNMSSSVLELFPTAMQESELGPIPQGWKVDSIKNRTDHIQYGFTQSSSDECVGPHFLRITDIRGGRVDWSQVPFCIASAEEVDRYRICDGDILVARTGASTGENIYIVEPPIAIFASYLVRFKILSRSVGRLVAEFMRTPDFFNHIAGYIGGSAQPNASAQALAGATMVFPTEEVADAFFELIRPLDLQRVANDRESTSLACARDRLLPQLLSGELSVAEAIDDKQ